LSGGVPRLWSNAGTDDDTTPWLAINADIFIETFSIPTIQQTLERAATALRFHPEFDLAREVVEDSLIQHYVVLSRLNEFKHLVCSKAQYKYWTL